SVAKRVCQELVQNSWGPQDTADGPGRPSSPALPSGIYAGSVLPYPCATGGAFPGAGIVPHAAASPVYCRQSSREALRSWLALPGLTPTRAARSIVRSPEAIASISRRSRPPQVASQSAKSIRKVACSSGGVRVLSASASSNALPSRVLYCGSAPTEKPCRLCAASVRTSWPLSRPPDFLPAQAWWVECFAIEKGKR